MTAKIRTVWQQKKMPKLAQQPTWVLLQVRLDVVIFGFSLLSAAVPAEGILLGF